MSDIQRTQPTVMLPRIDVEDENLKKILEEYNRILSELATNVYSDIKSASERLDALEGS